MILTELFQYDFMVRAMVAGIAIGVIAPLIGVFLVVRRYSLLADTLAHVSLVGVAVGLLTGVQPVLGALVASVLAALGVERLRRTRHVVAESVLALFLSGGLAVATVLISLARGFNANLLSFLFGSITTVQTSDIVVILGVGLLVIGVMVVFAKEFFAVAFDEELAHASGIRATFFNSVLVVLAAVTVALAMRVVGVLLVGALMVVPVITAMQFGRSFRETLVLSIVLSVAAVVLGLVLSYALGLPSGSAIVVVSLAMFGLSVLLKTNP